MDLRLSGKTALVTGSGQGTGLAMLQREVVLQRLGKPHEITDFAAFLVSPRASFSTGSVFTVDGG